jgi:Protein of unknown function (DUF1566)
MKLKFLLTLFVAGATLLHAEMIRDNMKNTVKDTETGLIWSDQIQSAKKMTINQAMNYCYEELGADWEIPTLQDLETLAAQKNALLKQTISDSGYPMDLPFSKFSSQMKAWMAAGEPSAFYSKKGFKWFGEDYYWSSTEAKLNPLYLKQRGGHSFWVVNFNSSGTIITLEVQSFGGPATAHTRCVRRGK